MKSSIAPSSSPSPCTSPYNFSSFNQRGNALHHENEHAILTDIDYNKIIAEFEKIIAEEESMTEPCHSLAEQCHHDLAQEVMAQVQVTRENEVYLMIAGNLSHKGAFLKGNPLIYPELKVGTHVEVVLFDVEAPGLSDVNLRAVIMRVDAPPLKERDQGFTLLFWSPTPDQDIRLIQLLNQCRKKTQTTIAR
jgi:hypothetical protein